MTTSANSLQRGVPAVGPQTLAANGLAIVRVTIGAMFVSVFFENLGKGLYKPAGYAGLINYYIKHESCAGCVEGGDGPGGKPCRDGCSHAGPDRDLSRYPAPHRSLHSARCNCGLSVSRQPLDFGVGHVVDMGTAGFGDGMPRARDRKRRPQVGR